MKFIHLSDLHIHTHADDNKAVSSILDFVAKSYPEHNLIITGDIVDDGTSAQFANAYAMLKPFQGRVFLCPGNHDFGAAGNFYSAERALRFDRTLAEPLNQGGTFKGDSTPVVNVVRAGGREVMVIALDSNLETDHPFDFACGEIGKSQLSALDTVLGRTSSARMIKMLFFHHHPFMVNDPFMELKDARKLVSTIFGRVDVVLFGHKHEMNQWENRWGAKYVLASDNSPGKHFAKEISISETDIKVTSIPLASQL